MKTYKEFINEAKVNSEADMMKSIEDSFKKNFPNGWINVRKTRILGDVISINLGLVSNASELTSKILENDPVFHKFMIHINEPEMKYQAELLTGRININPENKSYAMSSVKTNWRKTTGTPDKVAKAFDKFFSRLKGLVKENEANIYQRRNYSDKYFK